MNMLRALFSMLLLILIVTTMIDIVQRVTALDDAATRVLYSIAAFSIAMLALDYFEYRRK